MVVAKLDVVMDPSDSRHIQADSGVSVQGLTVSFIDENPKTHHQLKEAPTAEAQSSKEETQWQQQVAATTETITTTSTSSSPVNIPPSESTQFQQQHEYDQNADTDFMPMAGVNIPSPGYNYTNISTTNPLLVPPEYQYLQSLQQNQTNGFSSNFNGLANGSLLPQQQQLDVDAFMYAQQTQSQNMTRRSQSFTTNSKQSATTGSHSHSHSAGIPFPIGLGLGTQSNTNSVSAVSISDYLTSTIGSQQLDYADSWPECEVSIQVLDCTAIHLWSATFDLEFVVVLDWLDPQLVENSHFGFDWKSGKFVLWWDVAMDPEFFNPKIRIANAVQVQQLTNDSDYFPRIERLVDVNCSQLNWSGSCAGDSGGDLDNYDNQNIRSSVGSAASVSDNDTRDNDNVSESNSKQDEVSQSGWSFSQASNGLGFSNAAFSDYTAGGSSLLNGNNQNMQSREVPWLTKRFRFKGTLCFAGVRAAWFPIDVTHLRIQVQSEDLNGFTSMGQKRKVKLMDPLLRTAQNWHQKKSLAQLDDDNHEVEQDSHSASLLSGNKRSSFCNRFCCSVFSCWGTYTRGDADGNSNSMKCWSSSYVNFANSASNYVQDQLNNLFWNWYMPQHPQQAAVQVAQLLNSQLKKTSPHSWPSKTFGEMQLAAFGGGPSLGKSEHASAESEDWDTFQKDTHVHDATSSSGQHNINKWVQNVCSWSAMSDCDSASSVVGDAQASNNGMSGSNNDGDDTNTYSYQLDVLLTRNFNVYMFEFVIQLSMVIISCLSMWVPMTKYREETVAERLSITLTVVLTLVAFTMRRPNQIEEVPYKTLHDTYEIMMVFFCVFVAAENWLAYWLCFSGKVKSKAEQNFNTDVSDYEYVFVINDVKQIDDYEKVLDPDVQTPWNDTQRLLCSHEQSFGTTVIDLFSAVFLVLLIAVYILGLWSQGHMMRLRKIAKLQQTLSTGGSKYFDFSYHSRLMKQVMALSKGDTFEGFHNNFFSDECLLGADLQIVKQLGRSWSLIKTKGTCETTNSRLSNISQLEYLCVEADQFEFRLVSSGSKTHSQSYVSVELRPGDVISFLSDLSDGDEIYQFLSTRQNQVIKDYDNIERRKRNLITWDLIDQWKVFFLSPRYNRIPFHRSFTTPALLSKSFSFLWQKDTQSSLGNEASATATSLKNKRLTFEGGIVASSGSDPCEFENNNNSSSGQQATNLRRSNSKQRNGSTFTTKAKNSQGSSLIYARVRRFSYERLVMKKTVTCLDRFNSFEFTDELKTSVEIPKQIGILPKFLFGNSIFWLDRWRQQRARGKPIGRQAFMSAVEWQVAAKAAEYIQEQQAMKLRQESQELSRLPSGASFNLGSLRTKLFSAGFARSGSNLIMGRQGLKSNFGTSDGRNCLVSQAKQLLKFQNPADYEKVNIWPTVTTYVLDVGSGEIGFYSFCKMANGHVHMGNIAEKFKFTNKRDFITQFYLNGAAGVEEFAQLLIDKYKLVPTQLQNRASKASAQANVASMPLQTNLNQSSPAPSVQSQCLQTQSQAQQKSKLMQANPLQNRITRTTTNGGGYLQAQHPQVRLSQQQMQIADLQMLQTSSQSPWSANVNPNFPNLLQDQGRVRPSQAQPHSTWFDGKGNPIPTQSGKMKTLSVGQAQTTAGNINKVPNTSQNQNTTPNSKLRIYVGLTGKNKQYLMENPQEFGGLSNWLNNLREVLTSPKFGISNIGKINHLSFLTSRMEAAYELIWTQWLVQNGDLSCDLTNIPKGHEGAKFANLELTQCMERVFNSDFIAGKRNPVDALKERFNKEFRDLDLGSAPLMKLWNLWYFDGTQAQPQSQAQPQVQRQREPSKTKTRKFSTEELEKNRQLAIYRAQSWQQNQSCTSNEFEFELTQAQDLQLPASSTPIAMSMTITSDDCQLRQRKFSTYSEKEIVQLQSGTHTVPGLGMLKSSVSKPNFRSSDSSLSLLDNNQASYNNGSSNIINQAGQQIQNKHQLPVTDGALNYKPLLKVMLESQIFLRALSRARLFSGTISAGGGSCQVTFDGSAIAAADFLHSSTFDFGGNGNANSNAGGQKFNFNSSKTQYALGQGRSSWLQKNNKQSNRILYASIPCGNRTPYKERISFPDEFLGRSSTETYKLESLQQTSTGSQYDYEKGISIQGKYKQTQQSNSKKQVQFEKRLVWPSDTDFMTKQLLARWRRTVQHVIQTENIRKDLRGLYVGISAVYYAAEKCGCAEQILPKHAFLEKISSKIQSLLQKQNIAKDRYSLQKQLRKIKQKHCDQHQQFKKEGDEGHPQRQSHSTQAEEEEAEIPRPILKEEDMRIFSNLVLVHTFVSEVLHDSAFIVCKRKWSVPNRTNLNQKQGSNQLGQAHQSQTQTEISQTQQVQALSLAQPQSSSPTSNNICQTSSPSNMKNQEIKIPTETGGHVPISIAAISADKSTQSALAKDHNYNKSPEQENIKIDKNKSDVANTNSNTGTNTFVATWSLGFWLTAVRIHKKKIVL